MRSAQRSKKKFHFYFMLWSPWLHLHREEAYNFKSQLFKIELSLLVHQIHSLILYFLCCLNKVWTQSGLKSYRGKIFKSFKRNRKSKAQSSTGNLLCVQLQSHISGISEFNIILVGPSLNYIFCLQRKPYRIWIKMKLSPGI